jgi:hypothetical protein
MKNYVENLIKDDFVLLYLGSWDKSILSQCKAHPKVKLIESYSTDLELEEGEIIAFIADKEDSVLRDSTQRAELYDKLRESKAKAIILGYSLGLVSQK